MEIINEAQVEPHRLRALVKLIADLQEPKRQEIVDLLQPLKLVEGKSSSKEPQLAARTTYRIAIDCNLVTDAEKNTEKTTRALVSSENVAAMPSFQQCMQHALLNVTEQHQSNYLFNLYSAWYAVQE